MQPGSDSAVSMFDKDDVEAIGLVKFDFLGLATLTILELAQKFARATPSGATSDFDELPLDDAKVYDLFAQGLTGRCSSSNRRACSASCATPNRPLRGPDRAERDVPSRPDGEHPDLHRAQARPRAVEYPHPLLETVSARPTA